MEQPADRSGLVARLADWLDARANPFLIKGMRAGLRGRRLVMILVITLGGPLLMFAALVLDDQRHGLVDGNSFTGILLIGLSAVALFVVPFAAGSQLRESIQSRAWDLIQITRITPWQATLGHLQVSLVEFVFLFTLIFPFALVGFLLGGVELGSVLVSLLVSAALCMILTSVALLGSSLISLGEGYVMWGRMAPAVTLFAALAVTGLGGGMSAALIFDGSMRVTDWPMDIQQLLRGLGTLAGVLLLTVLALRLTADVLTPPAMRRHVSAQILSLIAVILASLLFWDDAEELYAPVMMGFLFLALIWSLQPAWQSPRYPLWLRFWMPFGGGYWRAMRLVLLVVIVMSVLMGLRDSLDLFGKLTLSAALTLNLFGWFVAMSALALLMLRVRDVRKRNVMQVMIGLVAVYFLASLTVMIATAAFDRETSRWILHSLAPIWLVVATERDFDLVGGSMMAWLVDGGRLLFGLTLAAVVSRDAHLLDNRAQQPPPASTARSRGEAKTETESVDAATVRADG